MDAVEEFLEHLNAAGLLDAEVPASVTDVMDEDWERWERDKTDAAFDSVFSSLKRAACQTFGHRISKWHRYKLKREEPVGKVFHWRDCLRCGTLLRGKSPGMLLMTNDFLRETYSLTRLKRFEEQESPIFASLGV